MATKEFKVSKRYPVFLKKESPKCRIGTNTKTKTVYYRSVINWTKKVWASNGNLGDKKGCYIFFWQDKPIYVGKTNAEKGFSKECFHSHKTGNSKKDGMGILTTYLQQKQVLRARTKKGATEESPMTLMFIYWPGKSNADLEMIIDEMESYLIIKALQKNKDLLNSRKKSKKWSIPGFDNDKGGNENSKELDKLL